LQKHLVRGGAGKLADGVDHPQGTKFLILHRVGESRDDGKAGLLEAPDQVILDGPVSCHPGTPGDEKADKRPVLSRDTS